MDIWDPFHNAVKKQYQDRVPQGPLVPGQAIPGSVPRMPAQLMRGNAVMDPQQAAALLAQTGATGNQQTFGQNNPINNMGMPQDPSLLAQAQQQGMANQQFNPMLQQMMGMNSPSAQDGMMSGLFGYSP